MEFTNEFRVILEWMNDNMHVLIAIIDKYIPKHMDGDYSFDDNMYDFFENVFMPKTLQFFLIFNKLLTLCDAIQDTILDESTDELLTGITGCYNHIVDVYNAVKYKIENRGS